MRPDDDPVLTKVRLNLFRGESNLPDTAYLGVTRSPLSGIYRLCFHLLF